jgi:hypothetical protein
MNSTKLIAAALIVAPFAAFAETAAESEMATPSFVPDMAMVADDGNAAVISGSTVSATDVETPALSIEATSDGAVVDAAEHDHGTMKKAMDDAVDSAETLKKTAE